MLFLLPLLLFLGCKDEEIETQSATSTVSFETTHSFSSEGSGLQEVNVILNHPQASETIVNFVIEGPATEENHTRFGNSDYELLTSSPLIIKKGETSAKIQFRVLEDALFEPEEEYFKLKMNGVLEGNAILDENQENVTFTHFIKENDFQLDLLWDTKNTQDAPGVDLYLEGSHNTLLTSEDHDFGKTIKLINAEDNENYYLEIGYEPQKSNFDYTLKVQRAALPELTLFAGTLEPYKSDNAHQVGDDYVIQNFRLIKNGTDFIFFK